MQPGASGLIDEVVPPDGDLPATAVGVGFLAARAGRLPPAGGIGDIVEDGVMVAPWPQTITPPPESAQERPLGQ